MKKILPTAHLEPMMGTPLQASDYCKKDGDWMEGGTLPDDPKTAAGKGGKATAAKFAQIIDLCASNKLGEVRKEHPSEYFRHYHTCKRIAMDNPQPLDSLPELNNEWIYGAPGVGKSRLAREENPGFYDKSLNKWWLGYKGEDVVIIDDLGKTAAVWIGEFLKRWGDHYPFPAETKGDGSLLRPKKIIITSNYSIDELFGEDESMCAAIKRRYKSRHIVDPIIFKKAVVPAIIIDVPIVPATIHTVGDDDEPSMGDTEKVKLTPHDGEEWRLRYDDTSEDAGDGTDVSIDFKNEDSWPELDNNYDSLDKHIVISLSSDDDNMFF